MKPASELLSQQVALNFFELVGIYLYLNNTCLNDSVLQITADTHSYVGSTAVAFGNRQAKDSPEDALYLSSRTFIYLLTRKVSRVTIHLFSGGGYCSTTPSKARHRMGVKYVHRFRCEMFVNHTQRNNLRMRPERKEHNKEAYWSSKTTVYKSVNGDSREQESEVSWQNTTIWLSWHDL